MTHQLYAAAVPDDALRTQDPQASNALQELAGLDVAGVVERTGQNPGRLQLTGQYRGTYAELLAAELDELLTADVTQTLEWYRTDAASAPTAGYYTAEASTNPGRLKPQSDAITRFDATLSREGTRASHRRAVATNPQTRTHQFGNTDTGLVAIPAAAGDAVWVDPETYESTPATPTDVVAAEFGGLSRYDLADAPVAGASLAYDLPYAASASVDTAVFDTWGNPEYDSEGVFAWQQVFRSDHDPVGTLIVENGRLELTLDTDAGLSARRWSSATDAWEAVSPPSTGWTLHGVDLQHPGAAQVRVRLMFRGGSGSASTVSCVLPRGSADALIYQPQGEQIPTGVVDRLTPVASPRLVDVQPTRTLIQRSQL